MKVKRVIDRLAERPNQGIVPRGVIEEGRIFDLGEFRNADIPHGQVTNVVDGLKEHIGQPFERHPWAFTIGMSTFEEDGEKTPLTFMEVVFPQNDGSVFVLQHILVRKLFRPVGQFLYQHTPNGTKVNIPTSAGQDQSPEERAAISQYPLAIALLNTRGCRIDFKRAPGLTNEKRKRLGKPPICAHYDVGASEYITAIRAEKSNKERGGAHASPIPHLRRAHERILSDGTRTWVSSALVNVRAEGDIAFVERRMAYRREQQGNQD